MLFITQNLYRELFKSEPGVFRIVQESNRKFPLPQSRTRHYVLQLLGI